MESASVDLKQVNEGKSSSTSASWLKIIVYP